MTLKFEIEKQQKRMSDEDSKDQDFNKLVEILTEENKDEFIKKVKGNKKEPQDDKKLENGKPTIKIQ